MKITTFVRGTFCILILSLFLIGCGHTSSSLSRTEEKWGPPAKIENFEDKIIYYYYFNRAKSSAKGIAVGGSNVAGIGGSEDAFAGWWVVELTFDREGNLLKKREYWKQPKLE
jgi:hypothetical protein